MMTFYQASDSLRINKNLLIITVFFLAFSQSHLLAQPPQKATLTGHIYDAETGQPLQAANVFIANSMLGAATDSTGYFVIRGVPAGAFELVVSMIGYHIEKRMLTVTGTEHEKLIFRLAPKVLQAPEIVVSAEDMKAWRKHLQKFTGLFFSNTKNAGACKILNPEVLDFTTDKPRTFRAMATAPLQIENRALGYRLDYFLEHFELTDDFLIFAGTAKFAEMTSGAAGDMEKWQANRLRAYNGSLRHFLSALVDNFRQTGGTLTGKKSIMDKEPLNDEGFYVLSVKDPYLFDKDPRAQKGNLISANRLLAPGELGFESKLGFSDYLQVIYTEESEEDGYLEYLKDFMREPSQQISWIRLPAGSLLFNTRGYPYDPLEVETHGYWAWQRVADMLPVDYVPPSQQPEMMQTEPEKLLAQMRDDCFDLTEDIDWQAALEAWWNSKIALEKDDKADPRIGFAFIEAATEVGLSDYFEKACEMYFCALSDAGWQTHPKAVLQEAERVLPLLPEEDAQHWRELIEKKDKSLVTKITKFWVEKDPTPSTPLNERLIQHWQRIAYARKNFRKSIKAPYQTDDRGVIYVKYGEPDRKKPLYLGTDLTEMMRWAELTFEVYTPQPSSFSRLKSKMEKFMHRPECEIWLYASLNENENVVFIFGNEEGSGSFRLVDGIEDLIPQGSFSRYSAQNIGLPAGVLLQTMYYGQLAAFDSFFDGRYRELEGAWMQAEAHAIEAGSNQHISSAFHNSTRSIKIRYDRMNKDNPARRYAPPEQSAFSDLGNSIRLSSAKVRRLDRRNQPKVSFVAFAVPEASGQGPEGISKKTTADRALKSYDLAYTLILRDSTMGELARYSEGAVPGLANTALFTIADNPQASHFTVAAEAVSRIVGMAILGSGQTFFAKDPPLDPDPQKLEVSDLVLGILPPENADFSSFPFPILPSRKIWRGDALQVYFEAYHLMPDADNSHRFSIDVRVTRLEKEKDKTKRKEMISTRFDFRSTTTTAKEFFGVNIEKLKEGDYELAVQVIDTNSSRRKRRVALFEVVER